jgi:hypothetical protein
MRGKCYSPAFKTLTAIGRLSRTPFRNQDLSCGVTKAGKRHTLGDELPAPFMALETSRPLPCSTTDTASDKMKIVDSG